LGVQGRSNLSVFTRWFKHFIVF